MICQLHQQVSTHKRVLGVFNILERDTLFPCGDEVRRAKKRKTGQVRGSVLNPKNDNSLSLGQRGGEDGAVSDGELS